VSQLLEAQEKAQQLEAQAAATAELQKSLGILYHSDAELTPEQAEPHMRKLLVAAGFEGEALEKQVATMPGWPENDEPPASPEAPTPDGGVDKATQLELKLLKGHLEEGLKTQARTGVLGDETVKGIIEFRKKSGATEEEISKLVDYFANEAYSESLRVIQKRYGETGTLEYSWLKDAVAPSVKHVAEKARQLTGDPKGLGPSAVDATGEALRTLLETKPAVAPKYSSEDPHALKEAVEDWGTDHIMRAVAELGSEGGAA